MKKKFLTTILVLIAFVDCITSTVSEDLNACVVKDCTNCLSSSSTQSFRKKLVLCEGPAEYSLRNNLTFVSSSNYTIRTHTALNQKDIDKIILRKINVGREFKLNLTGADNIGSFSIEESIVEVTFKLLAVLITN